jgi:hypothetical protein
VASRSSLKRFLIRILDEVVKPFLIVALCVAGLVFEFLLELPFIAVIGFHRRFVGRRP